MTPRSLPTVVLALLGVASLGASCGGGNPSSSPAPDPGPAAQVESLDAVDVSRLTRAEGRVWVELINDQLSPCGDPISVGRCAAEGGVCGRCVPAARYLARLVVDGYERSEIEDLYRLRYGRDTELEIDLEGAPSRGSPMAAVTIVEFSDFECPYCGRAHPILQQLLREYEGQVRLVFKHYPLSSHPHAGVAARAAVAADRQGRFWEMVDLMFEHQTELEEQDLERYAEQIGLDVDRFLDELDDPEVQEAVEADKEEGRRLGVEGTPAFFVNGRRFSEPPTALGAYIREELDR
ncbi:MAG: DsbA family protein [Sandaracinaceae bacterium]